MVLRRYYLLIFILVLLQGAVSASQFSGISDNYEYNGTLESKKIKKYKYYISKNRMGVLTLKNLNGSTHSSEIVIDIFSDSDMAKSLGTGSLSGGDTKMILIQRESEGRYVYIKVESTGNSSGNFKLFAHEVECKDWLNEESDLEELRKISSSVSKGFESVPGDQDEKNNASRIVMNAIRKVELGSVKRESLINQVKKTIQSNMEAGFWRSYAISSANRLIDKIYKYY